MSNIPIVPPPDVRTETVIVDTTGATSTTQSDKATPSTQISKPKFVQYPSENDAQKIETVPSIPRILKPNMKMHYDNKRVLKVIIIGDSGVGKTCLSFRFCNGRFPLRTEATIGVDFRERAVAINRDLIRVQLWDTAGQERYRQSIVAHYYRNVNAVVFVYDVTDPRSFRSLPIWVEECRKHGVTNSVPHILIGNKCDLRNPNSVHTVDAQVLADQYDMALFETSALADSESDHVEAIFMTLVHKLHQCKPMHVQTDAERVENEKKLLLKAEEAADLENGDGLCC